MVDVEAGQLPVADQIDAGVLLRMDHNTGRVDQGLF